VTSKLKKMGYRGSQTSELFFENFKVPVENILGEEGKGHVIVMNGLDSERAMIAPICLGISERALDISVEYSKIREQFGKPISSFQMIQSKIAEMYTSVQAIKAIVYSVLSECDNTDEKEFGRGKIHMNTAASVMFASSTTNDILDKAVQIHGGMGYMWESEANRLYRASKLLDIGAGTTEVRKMIISKELLK
jgi:isovaleryl-CoA dehydrogenase